MFHNGVGSHVELTSLGVEASLNSGDTGQYLNRQREQARPTSHTSITAGQVNYTQGDAHTNVHNNVEVHTALSPADLARLIDELAPALALDDESRAALQRIAQSLRQGRETRTTNPNATGSAA
ncbi:hypothetical protein NKH18_18175 [Streptomyces sp. M10(2022)]